MSTPNDLPKGRKPKGFRFRLSPIIDLSARRMRKGDTLNKAQNSGNNSTKRKLPQALEKYSWKPGQSGNPGGRPRNGIFKDLYTELSNQVVPGDLENRTYARLIAMAMFRKAVMGNIPAAAEIMDRVEGKAIPRQDFSLTMQEDDPKEKLREFAKKLAARKTVKK